MGRLPVIGALHDLDQAALVEILTQPKHAISRQYQGRLVRVPAAGGKPEPLGLLADGETGRIASTSLETGNGS